MPRRESVLGQTFGHLEVLSEAADSATGKRRMRCLCFCGNTATVFLSDLRSGHTQSCGCAQVAMMVERNTVHGMARTPEHRAWIEMKKRCNNAKLRQYRLWGGRGVKVCLEWERNFAAFFAAVGSKPGPEYSLDRYPDKDGDYKPGNVRWATDGEQSRNTAQNIWVEINGRRQIFKDWCVELGQNYPRARMRLHLGWDPIEALLAPKNTRKKAA